MVPGEHVCALLAKTVSAPKTVSRITVSSTYYCRFLSAYVLAPTALIMTRSTQIQAHAAPLTFLAHGAPYGMHSMTLRPT